MPVIGTFSAVKDGYAGTIRTSEPMTVIRVRDEARDKVWLYNLAVDPTERNELSKAEPARTQGMLAMLKAQDAETAKPMWPSLLQCPIMIDKPGGQKQAPGDEYILWDN